MGIICNQCGKTIEGEGMAFCPYCGAKLVTAAAAEPRDEEAEKWVSRALAVNSFPERRKILSEGLKACPGSREIEWELLVIGEEAPKRTRVMDDSIIRSWVLEIYRNPGSFTEERRNEMRFHLFDSPQLIRCLQMIEDPEMKQKEYLLRLSKHYIEIFLEGNSEVMGTLFGFSLYRNKEKRLATPAAQMIKRMKNDEKLSPDQREQLWKAFYQAYAARTGGTESLDQLMTDNG